MNRRFHRLLGVLLALPLLAWMLTGLLFHVKYRYAEAYETLKVPDAGAPRWSAATVSPAQALEKLEWDGKSPVALIAHPAGFAAYLFAAAGKAPAVLDATTGNRIAAADESAVRAWVMRALEASKNSERYGEIANVSEGTRISAHTGLAHPAFVFNFSRAKVVTVDRLTGEMSQTGTLNEWIDFTYRIHYLQWTPWQTANIALVLLAMPLVIGLAFSGVRMFVRRDR